MPEEALQQIRALAQSGKTCVYRFSDLFCIPILAIPYPLLDIAVTVFFRIQSRRIGWQVLYLDFRVAFQILFHLAAAMNGSVIPNKYDRPRHMPA